ncbi:MAG: hypothetical protein AB7P17_09840 [Nitrospirales bacterium]|nr:hypothetical protein [Nitrospirales bacterium]
MPIPHHTPDLESPIMEPDPLQRLSLAVKELNRLIHRAKHLGALAEQPLPHQESSKASLQDPEAPGPSDKK